MTENTEDDGDRTRGETPPGKKAGHETRVPSAVGWSQRPATGRSFFTMMVVVVLASGVAVFLATRSRPGQRTDRAAEALGRRLEAP